jgi:hypothetical protein
MLSVLRIGRMIDEYWIGKDIEGRGHGLIEVVFRNLPAETENNRENVSQDSCCLGQDSYR